jgi:hypothetical protein
MKKKIFISVLSIMIIIFCGGFTFNSCNVLTPSEENINDFNIEALNSFKDNNIKNYTLMELEILIIEQKNIQYNAHELAESARALGWPEDSESIIYAKIEWGNAQQAIEAYQQAYDEKVLAIKQAKWDQRKKEYPEATQTWLYMKSLGWNDYVCAGIMGNLMAETGGHTLNINPKSSNKNYYGICQWNKNHKKKVWGKNLKKQLEYLSSNIKSEFDIYGNAYKKGFNFDAFLNLENEQEAALAFAQAYERCGSASHSIRQENAVKAYNYFTK